MGMYTSITHPKDGRELQIKTLWDMCERYKLGDKIPWSPDPFHPGESVDGVYVSYSDKGEDDLVVIRDGFVTAIHARLEDVGKQIHDLIEAYGIKPPPRELWPEKDWKAKERRDAKAKAEQERWDKDHASLTPEQKMAAAFGEFFREKMGEPSLASRILPPEGTGKPNQYVLLTPDDVILASDEIWESKDRKWATIAPGLSEIIGMRLDAVYNRGCEPPIRRRLDSKTVLDALKVLTWTRATREWLRKNDPKALEQSEAALKAIGANPPRGWEELDND